MQRIEPSFDGEPVNLEIDNIEQAKKPILAGNYPSFYKRYFALFFDSIFVVVFFYFILLATEYLLGHSVTEQYLYFVLIAFIYDVFLTSKLCTIGQFVFGFRIRNDVSYEKISLTAACIRTISKWLLGWASFIVIIFSKKRRAIHDIMSESIVLSLKQLVEIQSVRV
ncbi:RDD family protein [Thalassomonas haliotis]|uniref:RDD family protein n=1 Tax=Thalassomonas haliotis TaxID=485448 RepID=A0ABY7VAH9_9GAMM|nr:RDD family protein [Thalassomonas haliotis]WDE10638.1 RDD family protein [Thalassomonas haliotis]